MPIDFEQLNYIYGRLWVYFVDHHILGQPALILLGALLVIACEAVFRKWDQTALYRLFVRRSISARIDIGFQLIQYLGIAFFLEAIFTLGISLGAVRLANAVSHQLVWARITLPADNLFEIVFSFLVYFLSAHFVGYWVHRLYHTSMFWHLHRFHHSAPELNFITFYRVHPAETFTRIFFFITPLTFLNAPSSVVMIALVVDIFLNLCQHSELPWGWGWIGRWLFASPHVHQLHHSIDDEHRDKNFSGSPVWDHVFGTWYDGSKVPSAYGITNTEGPDHRYDPEPIRQFMRDTFAFYRGLVAWLLYPVRKAIAWVRPSSTAENTGISAT